jgi:hypothetical protein
MIPLRKVDHPEYLTPRSLIFWLPYWLGHCHANIILGNPQRADDFAMLIAHHVLEAHPELRP